MALKDSGKQRNAALPRGYTVAGDSIGEGLTGAGKNYSWIGKRGVSIAAVAGQLTRADKGAHIIVTGGTNDADAGFSPRHLAASVDSVMKAAKKRGVTIDCWVGPVKPNRGAVRPAFARQLAQTSEFLKAYLGQKYNVTYIDLHAPQNRLPMGGYHPTDRAGYGQLRGIISAHMMGSAAPQHAAAPRPERRNAAPPLYS